MTMETIEKGKYEGWLWYSDEDSPKVFNVADECPATFDENINPFVVEGQLWSEETQTSISIRYVDGHYIIKKYDLSREDADAPTTERSFIAHRLGEVKRVKMRHYWKAESDPLCEGFEALMPDKLVFVGFDKEEE